ncbi:hypothetical protein CAC42_3603 [Sphaceloma murrayae]|uniref:Uncharacterized protein n=1 Tax=Sphaceloma murrayae TaxID=2082308 RepID=A0A2K1QSV2_9PEZI|nr:hypothetical protein CAC42_3603 [Sphaceloma murrayae]
MASLTALPQEILISLPDYLHNIEDYINLSASCSLCRDVLAGTNPRTILLLAHDQERIFFRPAPYFLVAAAAREFGHWARRSPASEATLATRMQGGIQGFSGLCTDHCDLTLDRIRGLHALRFSIINDQSVGRQWYSQPNFADKVSDAHTISSDTDTAFSLNPSDISSDCPPSTRPLSPFTRLEYIKYILPDIACDFNDRVLRVGPDARVADAPHSEFIEDPKNHHLALTWVIRSSKWRPHWKTFRTLVGGDFGESGDDGFWINEADGSYWKQRLWENVMLAQGLEGRGMIRPELQGIRVEKAKSWREAIARTNKQPELVKVGRMATHEYPFLLVDLWTSASGCVMGT